MDDGRGLAHKPARISGVTAIGDGVTDDTTELRASLASGGIASASGADYLVNDTITLASGFYDFAGATIKAGPGLAGKPLMAAANTAVLRLANLRLDCAGIALRGIYGSHLNTPGVSFDNVWVSGATGDGFYLDGCQAARLSGLTARYCGGHGIHALSCNATIVRDSLSELNTGDGVHVEPGSTGYSSGMSVIDSTIQNNTGNGISVGAAVLSPVKIRGNWIEANGANGILSSGKAYATHNYILTAHVTDNWAINITNTGRGVYVQNNLGGADNGGRVYCDNTDIADMAIAGLVIEPNYTAYTGAQSAYTRTVGGTIFPA